jgi:hypothetical protein
MVWLALAAVAAGQQEPANRGRLMGVVTDGSGGALPGVTVTVTDGRTTPATVYTDGSGRYLTPWLPPGVYTITFDLSGFETRTISQVRLDAAQTIVLDQQLPLASLSETVQVVAPAPPPPPPPPPPRPKYNPVDDDVLASACGVRLSPNFSLAIARVVGRRDNPNRGLMGPGDILHLDAGEEQGLKTGQNLVVRRRFVASDGGVAKKQQMLGEQTAGLVQIIETERSSATAIVVYACDEIVTGDTLEPYSAQPAFFAVSEGTPRFEDPARITLGEHGRRMGAQGHLMVIDRGIMQGVTRGQRITIFRRDTSDDREAVTIGDGVIIAVRADSSTLRIERSTDAVMVGDLVALHR